MTCNCYIEKNRIVGIEDSDLSQTVLDPAWSPEYNDQCTYIKTNEPKPIDINEQLLTNRLKEILSEKCDINSLQKVGDLFNGPQGLWKPYLVDILKRANHVTSARILLALLATNPEAANRLINEADLKHPLRILEAIRINFKGEEFRFLWKAGRDVGLQSFECSSFMPSGVFCVLGELKPTTISEDNYLGLNKNPCSEQKIPPDKCRIIKGMTDTFSFEAETECAEQRSVTFGLAWYYTGNDAKFSSIIINENEFVHYSETSLRGVLRKVADDIYKTYPFERGGEHEESDITVEIRAMVGGRYVRVNADRVYVLQDVTPQEFVDAIKGKLSAFGMTDVDIEFKSPFQEDSLHPARHRW